jgi:hypothetical protein
MGSSDGPARDETLAELMRLTGHPKTFERLLDSLPGAIDAGHGDRIIVALKVCAAWHGLYPVNRVLQQLDALARSGRLAQERPATDHDPGWEF